MAVGPPWSPCCCCCCGCPPCGAAVATGSCPIGGRCRCRRGDLRPCHINTTNQQQHVAARIQSVYTELSSFSLCGSQMTEVGKLLSLCVSETACEGRIQADSPPPAPFLRRAVKTVRAKYKSAVCTTTADRRTVSDRNLCELNRNY